MTLQNIAKLALQVQDACNLTAIVSSFSDCLKALKDLNYSHKEIKNHVATILFTDKIADLTGNVISNNFRAYSDAYDKCQNLAEGN